MSDQHPSTPPPVIDSTVVRVVHDAPGARLGISPPVQDGWCFTAAMPAGPHLRGPDGRTAAGSLGVLIDEVLGYAVMAGLGSDAWSISTELWIDMVGDLPDEGHLLADARSLQHGSFSTGQVLDDAGRTVASTRQRGRRIDFDPTPRAHAPIADPGGTGEAFAELLAIQLGDHGGQFVVGEQHVNPRGFLHGGVSLAACELAATAARVAAGSTLATTSVHVVHSRAVPLGSVAEVVVDTTFAGRSLQVSDVSLLVAGKLCAAARVSAQ